MSMSARDHVAAWLAQVHADPELSAGMFKLAFALSQVARDDGFIPSKSAARIGSAGAHEHVPENTEIEPIKQLIGRGHLQSCQKDRRTDGYQIVLRGKAKGAAGPAKTASVVPFPAARRRAFIRKHATRMAGLSRVHADAHLRQQLQIQTDTMRRRDVPETAIAREVQALESAIRAELWRCILTPDKPA
jgi:hypothetical protein